jgi:Ni,Fe-hydrogenase III large subunit
VRDVWGLSAVGGADGRPFLDHGRWAVSAPLSAQPLPRNAPPVQPEFPLPAGAEGLHQIPLGPVRPVPLGAAHLRLHVLGGTVAGMEAQGGYGHRGLVALMLGRSPRAAARVAGRVAADAAVAHALAFARAAEAATGTAPPPRALALRALMAEVERIAGHLRWWGGVCAAAGLGWPEARCALLREGVLRAAATAFGHRLMLDRVVPGGVAADLGRDGPAALHDALGAVAAALPELDGVGENHGGSRDRLAGRVVAGSALVARLGSGGPVGRAAGRGLDARRLPGGADGWAAALGLRVPVQAAGDAAARQRVLLAEVRASVGLAQALLDGMPPGEVLAPWPQRGGEGVGAVEGPRGLCLHWLALDEDGQIRAAFPFDPAWGHWPLLAAAMAEAPVSELPLAERSLLCSAAGVDL